MTITETRPTTVTMMTTTMTANDTCQSRHSTTTKGLRHWTYRPCCLSKNFFVALDLPFMLPHLSTREDDPSMWHWTYRPCYHSSDNFIVALDLAVHATTLDNFNVALDLAVHATTLDNS